MHGTRPLQMNKSRREADDTMIQLEEAKRETSRVALEGETELEKVLQCCMCPATRRSTVLGTALLC